MLCSALLISNPSAVLAESSGVRPACVPKPAQTWLNQHSCKRCVQHANDELDPATATLWFAGKQLLPKNRLSHHLGRHEKTKAVIKLQQAGQGAPAREAVGHRSAAVHLACCSPCSCASCLLFTTLLCIFPAVSQCSSASFLLFTMLLFILLAVLSRAELLRSSSTS